ncbi:hypothetical protein FOA52_004134 [Chlamydomonas sp. UWO 241]|nr:hypothetical protein FOA52_004134 [Chlamydomonas sp. UWO 241]
MSSKSTPISTIKKKRSAAPSAGPVQAQAPDPDVQQVLRALREDFEGDAPKQSAPPARAEPSSSASSEDGDGDGGDAFRSMFDPVVDIKVLLFAFVIFVVATKMPVERLIYQYVNVSNIPMSDIVIKGVVAAVITWFAFSDIGRVHTGP